MYRPIECAELAIIKIYMQGSVCITLAVVAKLASLSCITLLQACTKASTVDVDIFTQLNFHDSR